MRRVFVSLVLLASVFVAAMYATDRWIFAFAPAKVDELTVVYRETYDRVQLTPEQSALVLMELRQAANYPTLVDITSQPEEYVISHELLTMEGNRVRRYYVFLEQALVTDSEYQDLRQLGPQTVELIMTLRPKLPGQMDLVVPNYLPQAAGQSVPYTRYILPVTYGNSDFRVYTNGTWDVDWSRQAMIVAAWGERLGSGHDLQITAVDVIDGWLRVSVSYSSPEQTSDHILPTYPADAVLVSTDILEGLRGACFVDPQGAVFASQGLGNYPVERYLSAWPPDRILPSLPMEGQGIISSLAGDGRVQTLVVCYNHDATGSPVIDRIVEVAAGSFRVYVSYQPGEVRHAAVLISGYGSNWSFRIR